MPADAAGVRIPGDPPRGQWYSVNTSLPKAIQHRYLLTPGWTAYVGIRTVPVASERRRARPRPGVDRVNRPLRRGRSNSGYY